jgi:hypothetical protein
MHTSSLNHRLKRLERKFSVPDDGLFTLEELCRTMWHDSKSDFLKIAEGNSLRLFVAQFEREDAERNTASPRAKSRGREQHTILRNNGASRIPPLRDRGGTGWSGRQRLERFE